MQVGALTLAGTVAVGLDLKVAGFLVVLAGFGQVGYGLARAIVPTRRYPDRALAAMTFAFAVFALVAEALSLMSLLGSIVAWTAVAVVSGALGIIVRNHPRAALWWSAVRGRPSPQPSPRGRGRILPLPLGEGWDEGSALITRLGYILASALLLAAGLHLAAAFVLSWFAGINVGDSLTHYMPRSVRFLQYGTFGLNDVNYNEYMQYFHQTVVAVQLLFLRTDILVNPFSFVATSLTSVVVYLLAKSLGWPRHYALFSALTPLAMPILLLHATTSNFDTFIALWLALALYFLRRGFAASSPGWLVAAGTATALAFATKPTVWFVMPGLGLLWLAALTRTFRRGRLRRVWPAFAAATVILVLVGMPFLLRNQISRGYLLAPPHWQEFQLGGSSSGPLQRIRLLGFNTLAIGLQLVTPPYLLPDRIGDSLDPWFAQQAQALGYHLPDPSITVHEGWPGLIRHVSHRYDSNHAGLGAAFILVTLPSLFALPFLRRRLGPRWWYAAGLAMVGATYFLALNVVSIYSVNNIRYLIEMMAVLAPLGPALFVLLPPRIGGGLALAVSLVLLGEMHDIVMHNKQTPPDLVFRVPRPEQYFVFNGNPPTTARAAAVLDQKYPSDELPDIYVEDTGVPNFHDYTVQGPTLLRRTHLLPTPASATDLPGPFLTRDAGLAQRLVGGGQGVVDQLAADVWLVFPNDRPRVLFWTTRAPDGALRLRLQASVPSGQFAEPRYAFVLRTVRGEERLRGFEASPMLEIPFDVAGRGTIQIEMRDGDNNRRVERIRIERTRYMGLS